MESYSKKQKTRLKNNLCRDCGEKKTCKTTLCKKCKIRISTHMKQLRKERKKLKLCIGCGGVTDGKCASCTNCLSKRKKKQQNKRQQNSEEQKCYDCGISLNDKKKRCPKCSENKKNMRNMREIRLEKDGLCTSCGKNSYMDIFKYKKLSQKYCTTCHLKRRSSTQLGSSNRWKELLHILEKQKYKCYYSGEGLILGGNASIDHCYPQSRFPEKRHDINNIRWTTKSINLMKNDLTHEEFLELATKVIQLKNSNRMVT